MGRTRLDWRSGRRSLRCRQGCCRLHFRPNRRPYCRSCATHRNKRSAKEPTRRGRAGKEKVSRLNKDSASYNYCPCPAKFAEEVLGTCPDSWGRSLALLPTQDSLGCSHVVVFVVDPDHDYMF